MNVTIQGVEKKYDQVQALLPTSLCIRKGRITTLLGPSGCGKTTLLRIIAGLETPDRGEIRIGEEVIFSSGDKIDKPVHRRSFGMVFQDFALWPHMTVFENIAFGLRAKGRGKEAARLVQEAVAKVRLEGMEKRYPHQLSGGQQQRVAFARAIVTKPQLVLFDEPLSALDAQLRDEMRLELSNLVKQIGLTALFVTHDQTEAMTMSDEIVVMQKGRILQTGTPEQIYQTPAFPFVARFIGKSNWLEPDRRLFRPEHIEWSLREGWNAYTGTVEHVSYLGDRYELRLKTENQERWTAYRPNRLPVGEDVTFYVSPHHIHTIKESEED